MTVTNPACAYRTPCQDDRIGTWGTGPFDNDDARDWVYELEEATDLGFVRRTLQAALAADDYLERPEGNNAMAAAAIVAASLDGSQEGLSEEVVTWLGAGRERATGDDARLARGAVDRVAGQESEAASLWAESQSGSEWSGVVEALRHRLARATT